ncbi:hypothetical protein [Roseovarius sp. D22-M7]|uniref:hypothetical protein n=1 Tax=Roseovarius sp. D22-M7 TaxID=3127116 RepID=UPI0030103F4A
MAVIVMATRLRRSGKIALIAWDHFLDMAVLANKSRREAVARSNFPSIELLGPKRRVFQQNRLEAAD